MSWCSRRRPAALHAVVLLLTACSSSEILTGPTSRPSFEISDDPHGGITHFFFLPPMVPQPTYGGTSDGTLSPTVVVCVWSGTACGAIVAQFSTTSGTYNQIITYDPTAQQYEVNWHTDQCVSGPCTLDPTKTYRLTVSAANAELGHADVQVVQNGSELKDVNTNFYIALVDGRTLPVKFRIEQGLVASVTVTPNPASVAVGGTQQLTVTLLDLHGAMLTIPVTWASSNTAAATVSANGLVTGVGAGNTTVTASAGGRTGAAQVTVLANTWTSAAAVLADRWSGDGTAVINGKLYLPGGRGDTGTGTSTLFIFDPTAGPTGTWTTGADLPVCSSAGATAVINGQVYVLTGYCNGYRTDLDRYDPASNTWTPLASAPHIHAFPVVGAINGKLYVAGGEVPGQTLATVTPVLDVYDPQSDSWTTLSSMLTAVETAAGGVINGKLYVAGGNTASGPGNGDVAILQVYDPTSNTWSTAAPMPGGVRQLMGSGVVNGLLYVIGGRNYPNVLAYVEVYNPVTDTWGTKAAMPTARFGVATGVVNGALYVIGGNSNPDNQTPLAAVEAFSP